MSEELLELVKAHTICEQTSKLHTRANANVLASQVTKLIAKNLQDKPKLNTYINLIRHLSRQHVRKQCVNIDNVSVYLKHLPIVSTNQQDEDLYLPKTDFRDEINAFYEQQSYKKCTAHQRKALISSHTQQSLPSEFHYSVITSEPNSQPLKLQSLDKESKLQEGEVDCNVKQRESDVKLAMAVINLQATSMKTTVDNLSIKLTKYEELLHCEREFLKFLLTERHVPVKRLIELFPFLLEEELIELAMKHLEGKLVDKDFNQLGWIQGDAGVIHQAVNISQGLFVMAKYNFKLLDVLMSILK